MEVEAPRQNYACDPDTGKKPRDNTVFRPGDPFDIKWTVINTGAKTWVAGKDFDYFSGPHMTTASGISASGDQTRQELQRHL